MRQGDPLLPQPPGGMAPGAALAVAVHGGLVAALALSVNWRMQSPEVVSAELWSALPQVAAPRAEAPPPPAPAPAPTPAPPPPAPAPQPAPPPPREAQIATERAEKAKREEQEREREAAEKAERAKKQREQEDQKKREAEAKKAEEARVAKLREEQIKRMQGALEGQGSPQSTGTAERDAAPSQDYVNRLIRILRDNVTYPDTPGNPAVEIEVRAAPGGTILGRRVVKPSGVPEWDEAALRAVDKTGTLPRQADGRVPTSLIITFRPK